MIYICTALERCKVKPNKDCYLNACRHLEVVLNRKERDKLEPSISHIKSN